MENYVPPQQIENKSGSKALVWVKYLLLVVFVCFAVLYLWDYFLNKRIVNNITTLDPMIADQSDWKTYRNEKNGLIKTKKNTHTLPKLSTHKMILLLV